MLANLKKDKKENNNTKCKHFFNHSSELEGNRQYFVLCYIVEIHIVRWIIYMVDGCMTKASSVFRQTESSMPVLLLANWNNGWNEIFRFKTVPTANTQCIIVWNKVGLYFVIACIWFSTVYSYPLTNRMLVFILFLYISLSENWNNFLWTAPHAIIFEEHSRMKRKTTKITTSNSN